MKRSTLKKINQFLGIEFNWVSHLEKMISALGGFIGILLVFGISDYFVGTVDIPLIVASMGASAVLLFAVPHGALSQPWSLVGGHIISAFIGVTCAQWVPNVFVAAALAVSLAIAAMHYLRCIHPPGGATALTVIVGGENIYALGYQYVITPVLLNVLVILLTAILVNYFFSWRRYPIGLMNLPKPDSMTTPERPGEHPILSHNDLRYALTQINSFIDVTEDDLAKIYALAIQHSDAMFLQSSQIKLGHYYSNGQYGNQWSIRQIVDESGQKESETDQVIYKVVAGPGRRSSAICTREEFAQWAKYEVFRDENSWRVFDSE